MCFFFYVSHHFFFTKPTRARGKKQNSQRKKKTLAQCHRLPNRQMTSHPNLLCWAQSFFCLCFTKQCSFRSPRKFDFSWYLTSLRGQRTCSNDRNVQARRHYYQQSTFDDFNRKDLGFWFSVTRFACFRLILVKRALRCFQSFGESAWMASIMLFRIMVWDVHPITTSI